MSRGPFLICISRIPWKPDAPVATVSLDSVRILVGQKITQIADLAGFQVLRNTKNDPDSAGMVGFQACSPGELGAVFYDIGAAPGTHYFYWVKAFDSKGNKSAFSDVAVLDPVIPIKSDKAGPSSLSPESF